MATVPTPTGSPVASLCCCGSTCPLIGYNGVLWIPGFGTLDTDPSDYPDLTKFPITRNWLTKKLHLVATYSDPTGHFPPNASFPAVITYDGAINIDELSGAISIDESWSSTNGANPLNDGWAWVSTVVDAIYADSAQAGNPFDPVTGFTLDVSDTEISVSWTQGVIRVYSVVATITLENEYTQAQIQANLDSLMQQLSWDQVKALLAKQTQKTGIPSEDCTVSVCWDCAAFYGLNPAYPTAFFGTGQDTLASFYATLWPAYTGTDNKIIPPWNPMPAGAPILLTRGGINTNNPNDVNGTSNANGVAGPIVFDIQSASSIQFPAAFVPGGLLGSCLGQKILVVTGGVFCVAQSQDTALAAGPGPYQQGNTFLPQSNITTCTFFHGSSVNLPDGWEVPVPNLSFSGDNGWVNNYNAYYYGWSVNPSPTTLPNPFAPPCQQLCLPPT